jgi:hypothetical protein
MYGVQVWSGLIQYSIYQGVVQKAHAREAQEILPQGLSSGLGGKDCVGDDSTVGDSKVLLEGLRHDVDGDVHVALDHAPTRTSLD